MSGTPPPTDDITVELAEDLARQPTESPPPTRRVRRNVVGPFSLRQVTLAITAVMASAIVFTVATVPINQLVPNLPVPNPSAYLIGSPVPGLALGDLAPELALDLAEGRIELTDLDGRPIRLADLRGKAVWINFWASWCPPCQQETPIIRAMAERYRDAGLVVVAIAVQETEPADIRAYAERYDLDYTIGFDASGHVYREYRVFGLPTQFFIRPDGVIASVGKTVDEAGAVSAIEGILPAQ
jgi:thiol-disulfide isomerase/thioredoxin